MKTLTAEFAAHIAGEVTTLATCWRLERTDGWVCGFTDHDQDIGYDGLTYVASTGFHAQSHPHRRAPGIEGCIRRWFPNHGSRAGPAI
jgi:hypothetical protein